MSISSPTGGAATCLIGVSSHIKSHRGRLPPGPPGWANGPGRRRDDHEEGGVVPVASGIFEFGVKYGRSVERLAIVGDAAWEKWIAKLAVPLYVHEGRYFPESERDAA